MDDYDEANLDLSASDIKVYDSVSGADVTDFNLIDITVADDKVVANSKASVQKSLGDEENTQVIDTTKLAFGPLL